MKRIVDSSASPRVVPQLMHSIKVASGRWLLIAMIASLTLNSIKAQSADTRERGRINEVDEAIGTIHTSTPDLKGFKDVEVITSNAFTGRSKEDLALLAGRFYYDEAQKATKSWPGSKQVKQKVRKALANGWSSDKYSRAYYDRLLDDTKKRMARDQRYRKAIEEAVATAQGLTNKNWGPWTCVIDGWASPMSWCTMLANFQIWSVI
jgi:hypothetical protein